MKRLFTLFAVLAIFTLASCSEGGADNLNPNDKNEQPNDGNEDTETPEDDNDDSEQPSNCIYYTTTNDEELSLNSDTSTLFGATLLSNIYENGQGVMTFDDAITSIGANAFYECTNLESVTIGKSVTSIGKYAFYYCKSLVSVTLPKSLSTIEDGAFLGCWSLVNITIPQGVSFIGASAFDGCTSIENITIPNGITSIKSATFNGCSSLTSITIPQSVNSIESRAFWSCAALAEVYCKSTTPPVGEFTMFGQNAIGRKIYVPTQSVEAYKSADGWSTYADDIVGKDFE